MQIVIDIDDKDYKRIQGIPDVFNSLTSRTYSAIRNGIPLPEGHGDLKDSNNLKHAFISLSMAVHGNFTDADIASIIYNSPTILEADKNKEVNDDADSN